MEKLPAGLFECTEPLKPELSLEEQCSLVRREIATKTETAKKFSKNGVTVPVTLDYLVPHDDSVEKKITAELVAEAGLGNVKYFNEHVGAHYPEAYLDVPVGGISGVKKVIVLFNKKE